MILISETALSSGSGQALVTLFLHPKFISLFIFKFAQWFDLNQCSRVSDLGYQLFSWDLGREYIPFFIKYIKNWQINKAISIPKFSISKTRMSLNVNKTNPRLGMKWSCGITKLAFFFILLQYGINAKFPLENIVRKFNVLLKHVTQDHFCLNFLCDIPASGRGVVF